MYSQMELLSTYAHSYGRDLHMMLLDNIMSLGKEDTYKKY